MRSSTEQLSSSKILFENCRDAGQKLAAELAEYASQKTVVLALPNGGVPLAVEIATVLNADLDIIVCRKLVLPMVPEGGLGAVADDGTAVINEELITKKGISHDLLEYEAGVVKENVRQRSRRYRGESLPPRLTGKNAIIVDDGLASGMTMAVAVEAVRHRKPRQVIAAVPVASATGYNRVVHVADRVVTCAIANLPQFYLADFFHNWRDISDDEAAHILEQWRQRHT